MEAGNRRAEEEGLGRLRFQEGDACNLEGVKDDSFDLTISIFGAMFAPKPFDVAKEMVRVTKPRGRIVMVELDSERSDVCLGAAEDQLGVYASAAGWFCEPDEVGHRERHRGAVRRGGSAEGEYLAGEGHFLLHARRQGASGVYRAVRGYYGRR